MYAHMHTPRRSRISEITKAAEGLRSRLPAAVRVARGEMGESPLDEVSRRRQSLGEIGGRIVSQMQDRLSRQIQLISRHMKNARIGLGHPDHSRTHRSFEIRRCLRTKHIGIAIRHTDQGIASS